jgi:hypothetical protein
MKNKNTDLIAYGSYDIYIGRFLCLAYTIIKKAKQKSTSNKRKRQSREINT